VATSDSLLPVLTRHRIVVQLPAALWTKAGCFPRAALGASSFLRHLNQNPILTNIARRVHHVCTAHYSDALSVSAQTGGLSPEVRICRIDRPNNLPRKIHYNFQSSATHPANHSLLAVASRERTWILMNHGESLCLTAVDGNPSPACMCGRPAVLSPRTPGPSTGSTEQMREALTSLAAVMLYCPIFFGSPCS